MLGNKNWWKAAGIRAVKTFAQSAISLIPVATLAEIKWYTVIGTAALAAVVSLLMSLAGLPEVKLESRTWFNAMIVRVLKTMAETAAAMLPVAVSITEVNWLAVLSTAATAGVLSFLTSLKGLPEVDELPEVDDE